MRTFYYTFAEVEQQSPVNSKDSFEFLPKSSLRYVGGLTETAPKPVGCSTYFGFYFNVTFTRKD